MKKPIITVSLAAVNVIIFFILSFIGMPEDAGFLLRYGAMYVPYVVEYGEYYRIFTSMFLHFGFQHLMNNMVMLIALGWNLEAEIGKIKFLIIYIASGIGGTLLSMWYDFHTGEYVVSAGASGAVFGLIGASIYVAVRNRGRFGNVSGRGLLFMAALSLYYGYAGEGINNLAHIGGLITGMIFSVLLYRKRQGKNSSRSGGAAWSG